MTGVCPLMHEPDTDIGWCVVGPVTLDGRPMHTHVVPNCDMRRHQLDPSCWCQPVEDEEQANLWAHNSLDGREKYEQGDRRPN